MEDLISKLKPIIIENLNICVSYNDFVTINSEKISALLNFRPYNFAIFASKGLYGLFVFTGNGEIDFFHKKYGCRCWVDKSLNSGTFRFNDEISYMNSISEVNWSPTVKYEDYNKTKDLSIFW